MMRAFTALLAAVFLAGAGPLPSPTPKPTPGPDQILGAKLWTLVRDKWGDAYYPPYVTYTVGINYIRGGRRVELHYQTYEDLRRNLVYAHAFSYEEAADPKTPHGTDISAGGINGSGGFKLTHDASDDPVGTLALGINQDYRISHSVRSIRALSDATDVANASSLPIIGRSSTGTAKLDYDVRLVDTSPEEGVPIAHLHLTPLKDPHQYIVRDLWVNTTNDVVLRARLAENFNGGPLHDVTWIVTYTQIDGAPYISSETAETDVTYHEDEVLKNITITFTDVKGLNILPFRYAVGIEPNPAVMDP